jgi:hypothetical protein
MPPRDVVEARPRSTAEILDDAWRLYLADLPLLLALSALFFLPAAACLVALLGEPAGETWGPAWLLPLLASLLLPLTGLAAGACQEAYHSWAESYPIRFGECLKASLQRGLHHAASQGLALLLPVTFLVCLVSPVMPVGLRTAALAISLVLCVPVAMFGLSRQPSLAAGQKRFWRAVKHSIRATSQHAGRAFLVVVLRGVLLVFAVLNLHLFLSFGLWAAENLGGFDVAFVGVLCSLGNAAYLLTLTLAAAWLLLPWNEAVNYLFFVDARTRYEGLDLWQRIEELFPVKKQVKAGAVLLALALGLAGAGSAAAEEPLQAVRGVRQDLAVIRKEVQTANPYPGGQRWVGRLQALANRLDASSAKPGGYRWFHQAATAFAGHSQARALEVLDDLDVRLALIEDSWARPQHRPEGEPSKDHIKGLVPPDQQGKGEKKRQKADETSKKPKEPPPDDANNNQGGGGGLGGAPVGPGVVGPASLGSVAYPVLIVLVGLAAAALLVGIAFAVRQWYKERKKAVVRQQGQLAPRQADHLEDPDKQDPAELWQQSDELARRGDFLAAVRTLYLAVLALLHQAGVIRYERTRTNGEYVDQLRPRTLLHQPFVRLTGLFELKWYGERACEPEDYRACRELAGEIRGGATAA